MFHPKCGSLPYSLPYLPHRVPYLKKIKEISEAAKGTLVFPTFFSQMSIVALLIIAKR